MEYGVRISIFPPTLFVPLPFTAERGRKRAWGGSWGGGCASKQKVGGEAEELRGMKWKSLGVSLKKR